MEEKERYVIKDRKVVDTELNKTIYFIDNYVDKPVIDLLNQQDKRIKELKEVLEDAKLNVGNKVIDMTIKQNDLKKENQQLKQQLHDLPKKIVEYIKFFKGFYFDWKVGQKIFPAFKITEEDLDTILEKFGGEDDL